MANKTDEKANKEIGRFLKSARESKRVSQLEMAKSIDISKNHISAIERGVCKASVSMLIGYSKRLNMSPNDILDFKDIEILPRLKELLSSMDIEQQQKLYEIGRILIK